MTAKAEMVHVHVTPYLLGWQVKVNGRRTGTFVTQSDAQAVAVFLARLMEPTTLKVHGRRGRVRFEQTYPRSADPQETPG